MIRQGVDGLVLAEGLSAIKCYGQAEADTLGPSSRNGLNTEDPPPCFNNRW